ncbi:MAG: hypothetical protein KGD59_04695, partial [Candidatus Heimdallarchaeota archaeon]|nr:hypothetical protein [Candidatus Heimdallarchaeota archaeon]
ATFFSVLKDEIPPRETHCQGILLRFFNGTTKFMRRLTKKWEILFPKANLSVDIKKLLELIA